ncbi:hypothetical protein N9954_09555 [Maribacter sp.]|nr:hypothetical protein [Maribacter sp.]
MRNTIINSSLAFTAAFLLTILLHELAHFLMAITLGYESTLFHNRVVTPVPFETDHQELLFAGIAPLFSLLQGIVFLKISATAGPSIKSLTCSWIGICGLITFFGYLMISPIVPFGDTGKVFSIFNIPVVLQIIISIVSVVAITLILMRSVRLFEKFISGDLNAVKKVRLKWGNALILFPLLTGIIIVSVLQFPIAFLVSILGAMLSPFPIFALYGTFVGSKKEIFSTGKSTDVNTALSYYLIGFLIVLLLTNRFLLNGITF